MSTLNAPLDEQIFVALQAYEKIKYQALRLDLPSQITTNGLGRLSFNDIVNCVKAPDTKLSQHALSIVNQSLDYRRKYRFVLMQMSMLQSPRQIAASTSLQLFERREEAFVFAIFEQKDERSLLQLTLLQNDSESPGNTVAFLHCESEGAIQVLTLHSDTSDQFVLAINKDDTRLPALTNVNTHIYVTF